MKSNHDQLRGRALLRRVLLGPALLALSPLIPAAHASEWDKKTTITVNESIEIPGAVLQPGNYVMKLVDMPSSRHVVRFMNARENQVIATVMTVPVYRTQPSGRTVLTFFETPVGQPEALKEWFYPGDQYGQQFLYSKADRSRLAQQTRASGDLTAHRAEPATVAPAAAESATPAETASPVETAKAEEPAPDPVKSINEGTPAIAAAPEAGGYANGYANNDAAKPASDEPELLAQNNPPQANPQPAPPAELPRTGTQTAAIAVLGLGALAGSLAIRTFVRRAS